MPRVVEAISTEILQQAAFEPAKADRTFTILTPDIGEMAFIPDVLESGQAELAVGFFPDLQKAGFFQQGLLAPPHAA